MSTRGLVGVVIDGVVKATYNHSDSYPSGLGVDTTDNIVAAMEEGRLEDMKEKARKMVLIPSEAADLPPDDSLRTLLKSAGVEAENAAETVYQMMKRLRGNGAMGFLDAGVLIDGADFAADSLFCEWGYLADLDRGALEVFEGFAKSPHSDGRFADLPEDLPPHRVGKSREFWPIRQILDIPFADLDGGWAGDFHTLSALFDGDCESEDGGNDGRQSAHERVEAMIRFEPWWVGQAAEKASAYKNKQAA